MLPDSFTINTSLAHYTNNAADFTDMTFEKRSDDASRVIYGADAQPLGEPLLVTLAPRLAKPGLTGVDRYSLKIQDNAIDAVGKSHVATIGFSSACPRTEVFPSSRLFRNLCILVSLLHPSDQSLFTGSGENVIFWNSLKKYSL